MRQSDPSPYREGVVLERPGCKLSSLVDCGLDQVHPVEQLGCSGDIHWATIKLAWCWKINVAMVI